MFYLIRLSTCENSFFLNLTPKKTQKQKGVIMGFTGTFARLKSRLSEMAGNQVRYGPNGPGNQAPGRSASMLTRTASRGRYIGIGPYFAVKGLNFFRYFAGKGGEISRKFRGNFEISLTFQNFLRAHMRTVPCFQLPYLSISLTRFPSQNEVPRFVPL